MNLPYVIMLLSRHIYYANLKQKKQQKKNCSNEEYNLICIDASIGGIMLNN